MPFKFKLSRRLARFKCWTALVLFLPIACVNQDKLGLGPSDELPTEVARVVIAPRFVSLKVGGTVVLTAVALSATGDTAAAPLYWKVSSGTVAEETTSKPGKRVGHYKAPNRSGQDTVIVGDSTGHADTAIVDVNETPVASVTVSPSAPSLGVGETVQLTAVTKDSVGNTLSNRPASWSTSASGVATVSSSGLVTGVAAGSATITASSEGKSGTATVTVIQNQLDVVINPGESIQQAVDAHPAGTSFLIKAGVHRLQSVSPKQGNAFVGEPGAILSGARLLTQFVREGSYWVVTGQTQAGLVRDACDVPGCGHPEDLFLDDLPLLQVLSLAEVGPGKWFFDYAADRVYFYDDPTGRRVEISATQEAFRPSADNVIIRRLIIEKYANPAQHGAIHIGTNAQDVRSGWVVEASELRLNHGVGIRIGNTARVVGNNVHHNGQLGIGGIGDDVVVENNEIAYNNTMGYNAGWEAGGTKFVYTHRLVVRNNYSHHNRGPGLWTDGDNIDVLYEGNRVTDNASQGIFHEISYAAVVRNNVVERNGFGTGAWLYGAGILIAHSPNVEVYGNTVTDNFNGIAGIQQNRGNGRYGPYHLENLWVHDNLVTSITRGLTGIAQDVGDTSVFTGRNNRFDRNTYCLGSNTRYFEWANGMRTAVEWVQVFGQDVNGKFSC